MKPGLFGTLLALKPDSIVSGPRPFQVRTLTKLWAACCAG